MLILFIYLFCTRTVTYRCLSDLLYQHFSLLSFNFEYRTNLEFTLHFGLWNSSLLFQRRYLFLNGWERERRFAYLHLRIHNTHNNRIRRTLSILSAIFIAYSLLGYWYRLVSYKQSVYTGVFLYKKKKTQKSRTNIYFLYMLSPSKCTGVGFPMKLFNFPMIDV